MDTRRRPGSGMWGAIHPQVSLILVGLGGWLLLSGQPNDFLRHLFVLVSIQSITLLGLILLMGYAGQISVGHAAFYGLGAYTAAILATRFSVGFLTALLVGAVAAAVVAFLIGLPSLRLRGYYLALSTLAFSELVFILLREMSWLTGGTSGIYDIPRPSILGFPLSGSQTYFSLTWLIFIFLAYFGRNLARSRHGRALLALHGDEMTAETLGVDAYRYKVIIFVFSGLCAGLGGGLYTFYIRFIRPEMAGLEPSILFLLMAFFGGVASVWGALLGAAILVLTSDLLAGLHDWNTVVYGLLLILVILYFPGGLARFLEERLPGLEQVISRPWQVSRLWLGRAGSSLAEPHPLDESEESESIPDIRPTERKAP